MTTVLVVDDRATNREIARAALDDGGYQVIEAAEGRQALALAKAYHPDVVLTDVLMPGMDGYEFVRELRGDPDTTDIPVLFYTANYSQDEALPLAATVGVSKILSKSGDPLDLLRAVEEALHDHPAPVGITDGDFQTQHNYAVNTKLLEKVQALDESEARFATMAEASPMGIVIGDPQGRATYVNPRLSEITRTLPAALLGQGWQQYLSHEHRQALRADPDLNLGPDGLRHRAQITLPDGQTRFLTVLIQPVRDSESTVTGFVAMIDDITATVEADEHQRAKEREREGESRQQITARFDSLARLAGGVAHDFNNMLNVILSFDEFIKESVKEASGTLLSDDRANAILADAEQIYRAGQRAAHITHQLLTFGGREVVTPTPIDVNALVGEVRDMIAGTIGRHITITTHLDPRLHHVLADANQLTQILINLAVNAREAMPDGGQLHLETANTRTDTSPHIATLATGDYVHIAIADTGHGMSAEVAHQAMEPFYTTKPRGQSTGLGLATSYGVIKQAGGELVIQSAPGEGTTLHIYLPAAHRPVPTTTHAPTASASAGQTILVAEDEDGVRDVVTRILTRAGYTVLAAPNGREALTIAEHHTDIIDALLTDVVMPVMNGRELAEAVHHLRPDIPVLYMSGYAAPLMTEQGLLGPGVTVLGKPFTKTELLAAVGTLTSPEHLTTRQPAARTSASAKA